MFDFYIDTANIDYINNLVNKVDFDKERCLGITTNPNAMVKEGHKSLKSWLETIPKLASLVYDIRGDYHGQVHVQIPNCEMPLGEILEFIKMVKDIFPTEYADLAIKIPPYLSATQISCLRGLAFLNVTGLTDAGTCLGCLFKGVDYVSIIPGRMEELYIDANAHLEYLCCSMDGSKKVITGSMRTLQGLTNAIQYNTLPTIGTRVWDLILDQPEFMNQEFDIYTGNRPYCPFGDEDTSSLSRNFFKQMNELGAEAYKDFKCDSQSS
jgi:transaldolase